MTEPTASRNGALASTKTSPAAAEEKKYQHYAYAKAATQLITDSGKKFSFVDHKFITDDQEIIEYLDREIAAGLGVITKGALLSSRESDPMRSVKEKAVADYIAEQARLNTDKALGVSADMGKTDQKAQFSPMSTKELTTAGVNATAGASGGAAAK